jgi:hypothetical protein
LNLGRREVVDGSLSSVVRVRRVVEESLLLPEVSELEVVEVSPGLMSVVSGGLVLVIVVVVVDEEKLVAVDEVLGAM